MVKKLNTKDNFDKGWKYMHGTGLQKQLIEYDENFEGNNSLGSEAYKILGNRGKSHSVRLKMFKELASSTKQSKENQSYISGILDVYYGYLKEKKQLKTTGHTRLERKVKNFAELTENIRELKRNYETRGIDKLYQAEKEFKERAPLYSNTKIQIKENSQQKAKKNYSLIGKIGKWGTGIAAAAVIALGISANKPTIASNNVQSNVSPNIKIVKSESSPTYNFIIPSENNESEIIDLTSRLEKQKEINSGLEGQLAIAGRPDSEVTREAIASSEEKYEQKMQKLKESVENSNKTIKKLKGQSVSRKEYNKLLAQSQEFKVKLTQYQEREKELKLIDADKLELSEGIHKIASNLTLPAFPIAKAVINPKTNLIESVHEIRYLSQGDFGKINTAKELNMVADAIANIYEPIKGLEEINSLAFENLTSKIKVNAKLASELEKGEGITSLDELILFSREFQNSPNELVVRQNSEDGKLTVIGSLDSIKQLKRKAK